MLHFDVLGVFLALSFVTEHRACSMICYLRNKSGSNVRSQNDIPGSVGPGKLWVPVLQREIAK